MSVFKTVDPRVDFPEMERKILDWWYKSGIVARYLQRNDKSAKKFSFLDGPITANNPMGVHHAWGRTYKDLWQRYFNMRGFKQRFQNGFDCQGLWVEVEVEKELGFKSKKDIEKYGIANFVEKCKERVRQYAAIQTEQSKRLGYFMDWDHSYYTMSDENNYTIWHFLKVCFERGWIYKGRDSVPWCPRCETAISQHEILTEDYQELTHDSITMKFPLVDRHNEFLLVWTTTPWTIPANVAVAVDQDIEYAMVIDDRNRRYWLAKSLVNKVFSTVLHRTVESYRIDKTVKGKDLVGLRYLTAFDGLEAVETARKENPTKLHIVVATDPLIMPISTEEGTGMVHTAVSAGEEDFKLGKKLGLPIIPVIADNADYLPGLGEFAGKNAKNNPRIVLDYLEKKDKEEHQWVFSVFPHKHRYPVCWRCKTELVWKVADEWYIAMDKPEDRKTGKTEERTLREQLKTIAKKIKWIPGFGLERELDWLDNMHDWLISKKNRYWGLALPIYECHNCGHFEVIGSKEELRQKAISGWDKFAGHTPHRPWIDEVKIKCSKCGEEVSRISDVGNPWLDAGIVSFSTITENNQGEPLYFKDKKKWRQWFPADFITESFPGQFKNWFYSLLVMSTVLEKEVPFRTVLGFATLLGEDGRPMHKSLGNAIEFNEGADKIGVDVMRWMYLTQNPVDNLLFGYHKADEVRRRFHLMLWNVYNFFVTYANVDNVKCQMSNVKSKNVLDRWILSRLHELIKVVTDSLDNYDAQSASLAIEKFVEDLSLWYVRRSRDRVGPTVENGEWRMENGEKTWVENVDKNACYATLYEVLVTLSKLLAPFTPFLAEEIYKNLMSHCHSTAIQSVHLEDWPKVQTSYINISYTKQMEQVRKICELGHGERKRLGIKVRQPLRNLKCQMSNGKSTLGNGKGRREYEQLIKDELNVKEVEWLEGKGELSLELDTTMTPQLRAEGEARELVRQIQELRKEKGCQLDEKITVYAPYPKGFEDYIKKQTLAKKLIWQKSLRILTG